MRVPLTCPRCNGSHRPAARFCGHCGFALPAMTGPVEGHPAQRLAGMPLESGVRLGAQGRYEIKERLGGGGFGVVYLASDQQLSRECVIKQLRLDGLRPEHYRWASDAFEREALLLASLNTPGHQSIPEVFEYLSDEYCLVMKFIAGESLGDMLLSLYPRGMPEEVALPIARAVCSALVYIHGRKPEPIIHRDVKPQNILIGKDGRVWLVDFGLGKGVNPAAMSSMHPGDSTSSGTRGFTPLEQWNGRSVPASDVYALATTLYVMLTGALPPPEAPSPPQARPALAHLIMQGLSPQPADRPTAQDFLTHLELLIAKPELRPPPQAPRPPSTSTFVGRDAELAGYAAQLGEHHLAVITGMAGVGKTTLAAALAGREGEPARTFWYTFYEGEGVEALTQDLAAFLYRNGQTDLWELVQGGRPATMQPSFASMLDFGLQLLRGRDYLICLDDLHHVESDPLGAQFATRLATAARSGELRLIVTARTRPGFVKSDLSALQGLGLTDTAALLARLGVTLAPPQVGELHQRTAGNPQLLTLAAAALRDAREPERLIGRLEGEANIADYLLREIDDSLATTERNTMVAIAVLLDYGGDREAIEAVSDGENSWRVLQALRQRHLITVQDDLGNPVYSQHALVRGFYYQQPGRGARALMHRRAAEHYELRDEALKAARHYTLAGEHVRATDLALADIWKQVNRGSAHALRSVIEQIAGETLDDDRRIALDLAHGELSALLGDKDGAQERFRAIIDRLGTGTTHEPLLLARAYRGLGEALEQEAPQEAVSWLEQGLAAIGTRDAELAGAILSRKGSALIALGDYDAAREALEQGLALFGSLGSTARADALTNLGAVRCAQGDVAAGVAHYHEALAIYERTASAWKIVGVWNNLGIEQVLAGAWGDAETSFRRGLAEAERLGSVVRLCDLTLSLGILFGRQGKLAEAREQLEQSLALARKHTLHEQLVAGLASLAALQLQMGATAAAAAALDEARTLADVIEARDQLPELLRVAAALQSARGDPGGAAEQAEAAVEASRELGLDSEEGAALRELALALVALGRTDEAEGCFANSATLLAADPYEHALTNLAWARLYLARGDEDEGQALLATAHQALADLGVITPP